MLPKNGRGLLTPARDDVFTGCGQFLALLERRLFSDSFSVSFREIGGLDFSTVATFDRDLDRPDSTEAGSGIGADERVRDAVGAFETRVRDLEWSSEETAAPVALAGLEAGLDGDVNLFGATARSRLGSARDDGTGAAAADRTRGLVC